MLASITPLGERGRQSHWSITITAFALGAVVAGAAAGALLGGLGWLLLRAIAENARLALLAAAVALAIALDARAPRVPGPRRQVSERWLDEYRGWVYGLGFGAQLGVGVATIVSSAATYVALLAAGLSADPLGGAVIVGCYGAVRGLQPLTAAGVRTQRGLIALHGRLDRARALVRPAALASMTAILALALAGSLA